MTPAAAGGHALKKHETLQTFGHLQQTHFQAVKSKENPGAE